MPRASSRSSRWRTPPRDNRRSGRCCCSTPPISRSGYGGRSGRRSPKAEASSRRAFGRATGIGSEWLANLFQFAPRPTERRFVDRTAARAGRGNGFVEFGFAQVTKVALGATRAQLVDRMATHLRANARRHGVPAMKV
ncbi:MAG: hypothetical protein AUH72_19460 [Acidobacteria bacterium 13_1_40CM_4_65_8]|nr:MAG: hypothetical protein AUH72_19460 [Acidobacteria bacterium 13_1_40CM_4_65_8]